MIREATKCFDAPQLPENEYIFTQPDLRKAFYYSDLENQTLLSLAVALTCNGESDFMICCKCGQGLIERCSHKK